MSTRCSLVLLGALGAACSDSSHSSGHVPDAAGHAPDAALPEAGTGEPADAALTDLPETFTIALSGTGCYGDCPSFTVSLDEAGALSFHGKKCVARPGVYTRAVPPEHAEAMMRELRLMNYEVLRDTYLDEDDGCVGGTSEDTPGAQLSIEANAEAKTVSWDSTCDGVPAIAELDALAQLLRDEVADWLEPRFNCGYLAAKKVDASYRISLAGKDVGVLTLAGGNSVDGTFTMAGCDGTTTAAGDVINEDGRRNLIGHDETAIVLPSGMGMVGGMALPIPNSLAEPGPPSTLIAYRNDDALTFSVVEASGCSDE